MCDFGAPQKAKRAQRRREQPWWKGDVNVLVGVGTGQGVSGGVWDAEVGHGWTGSPGLRRVAEHEMINKSLLGERQVGAGLWEALHNLLRSLEFT